MNIRFPLFCSPPVCCYSEKREKEYLSKRYSYDIGNDIREDICIIKYIYDTESFISKDIAIYKIHV